MRMDAVVMTLADNLQGRDSRMDRLLQARNSDVAQGFGRADSENRTGKANFQKTYEQVARSNDRAREIGEKKTVSRANQQEKNSESVQEKSDRNEVTESTQDYVNDTSRTVDTDNKTVETDSADEQSGIEQAVIIVRQVLTTITQTLSLPANSGLEDLEINPDSENTVEQFSEILAAMKNILSVLDQSIAQERPLEVAGKELDVPAMKEMATTIRTEQFRFEMAIGIMGISKPTLERLAEKLEQPLTTGILQASNPMQLAMPSTHIEKAFGQLLNDMGQNLSDLPEKIVASVKDFIRQSQTSGEIKVNVEESSESKSNKVIGNFDSSTLRGMLKIDNEEDQKLVKVKGSDGTDKASMTDLGNIAVKNIVLKSSVKPDSQKSIEMPLVGMKQSHTTVNTMTVKVHGLPSKMIDETVMQQINDKLHSAVRSGVTEVRLQLRPESLGEVHMRIRLEGDVVVARIQVESQQVKQIVEGNLQNLKDSLASQNLQAGSFEVNVGGQFNHDTQAQWNEQFHHNETSEKEQTESQSVSRETAQTEVKSMGVETGKRYGNNSIEFFA